MLGNAKDARTAHRLTQEYLEDIKPSWKDKDWKKLGEGSTRIAWLSPKGIVYKVVHDGDPDVNLEEYVTYRAHRKTKAKGFTLAPCQLYTLNIPETPHQNKYTAHVNAQKYVKGRKETWSWSSDRGDEMENILYRGFKKYGLTDYHSDQYRIVGNTRVIFDYAC